MIVPLCLSLARAVPVAQPTCLNKRPARYKAGFLSNLASDEFFYSTGLFGYALNVIVEYAFNN